ncbi:hypothetical protein L3X38_013347 [Prunus dulcis]|uniref:Uncharacterized protein n=1 Tax=Prunus dulcis TaxID=3755 RepID=A0AAD4WL22_PRUDU|nr:hypothetical protein L3X38_013347 [Prunus dulcis]
MQLRGVRIPLGAKTSRVSSKKHKRRGSQGQEEGGDKRRLKSEARESEPDAMDQVRGRTTSAWGVPLRSSSRLKAKEYAMTLHNISSMSMGLVWKRSWPGNLNWTKAMAVGMVKPKMRWWIIFIRLVCCAGK